MDQKGSKQGGENGDLKGFVNAHHTPKISEVGCPGIVEGLDLEDDAWECV